MKPWEVKDNDLLLTKKEAVFIDDERRRLAEENTKLRGDLQKMHWQLTLMQCKLENNGIDIPFPPQTKPLSDEEIAKIIKDSIEDDYNMIANPWVLARAIEERHGIK